MGTFLGSHAHACVLAVVNVVFGKAARGQSGEIPHGRGREEQLSLSGRTGTRVEGSHLTSRECPQLYPTGMLDFKSPLLSP